MRARNVNSTPDMKHRYTSAGKPGPFHRRRLDSPIVHRRRPRRFLFDLVKFIYLDKKRLGRQHGTRCKGRRREYGKQYLVGRGPAHCLNLDSDGFLHAVEVEAESLGANTRPIFRRWPSPYSCRFPVQRMGEPQYMRANPNLLEDGSDATEIVVLSETWELSTIESFSITEI